MNTKYERYQKYALKKVGKVDKICKAKQNTEKLKQQKKNYIKINKGKRFVTRYRKRSFSKINQHILAKSKLSFKKDIDRKY